MKIRNSFSLLLAALVLFGTVSPLPAASKAPRPKTLLDFTSQDVDRNGAEMTPIKRYSYSYDQWNGKVVFLDGRGLLLPYVVNKGGFGGDRSMKLADYSAVELALVIGDRNEATACAITLIDADGTEATWNLPLANRPRGVLQLHRLELARCDKEDKPGSTPGLDKARIKKWQIKAGWQEKRIEVLFVRLDAVP